MKTENFFLCVSIVLALFLSSCNSEPDDVSLVSDKSTVALNEEVTFTITGDVHDYCNFNWTIPNDGADNNPVSLTPGVDFEVVSGFNEGDLESTLKFFKTGNFEVGATIYDCGSGCDRECTPWFKETYIEVK
ncbi:MAG: hypothetical protein ACNS60_07605 [Candidatus Cyclobacteriaceae bacterium M2_1C_046]